MSNWVYNEMSVYGEKQKLAEFKEHVAGKNLSGFSFENITPKPNETSSWAKGGFPGWLNWGYEHWGTKWDAWDTDLLFKKDCLQCKFTTANSPPFPIYDKLIESFPQLSFEIVSYETVNDWAYELEAKNGEYTKIIEETMDPLPMESLKWDNFSVEKMLCSRKDILNNRTHVSIEEIIWKSCTKDTAASASENINLESDRNVEDEDEDILRN